MALRTRSIAGSVLVPFFTEGDEGIDINARAGLVVRRASDRNAARRDCPTSVDQPSPMPTRAPALHVLKLQRRKRTWVILSDRRVDGELYYIARVGIRARAPAECRARRRRRRSSPTWRGSTRST